MIEALNYFAKRTNRIPVFCELISRQFKSEFGKKKYLIKDSEGNTYVVDLDAIDSGEDGLVKFAYNGPVK